MATHPNSSQQPKISTTTILPQSKNLTKIKFFKEEMKMTRGTNLMQQFIYYHK